MNRNLLEANKLFQVLVDLCIFCNCATNLVSLYTLAELANTPFAIPFSLSFQEKNKTVA